MITRVVAITQRLQFLYHGIGMTGVLRLVGQRLLTPIYRREAQYIIMRSEREAASSDPITDRAGIECVVIESLEALEREEKDIRGAGLFQKLSGRLKEGCVVF